MHLYNYVINNYNSRDVPRKLWAHLSTCNTHTNSMLIVVCSNLYDELAQYNYNKQFDEKLIPHYIKSRDQSLSHSIIPSHTH